MKVTFPSFLQSPRPRPALVGDGVALSQERTEGCDRRELLLDQLDRMARLNVLYVQGLREAARCQPSF